MNSLERTLAFIKGKKVDRVPLHPIIMRFAAKYANLPYSEFCLDPARKCMAASKCAEDFGLDWVTVMSDPYAEASALGLKVDYPHDTLPKHCEYLLKTEADFGRLKCPKVHEHERLKARIEEIEIFHKHYQDNMLIVGWVEGAFAEYADLRGLSDACLDLYDNPQKVRKTCDILFELAAEFAKQQIKAGANCIGIGEAACSQISPDLYRQFFFTYDKELVESVHSLGAIAKIHICGNISGILNDLIKTGADIIDVDHMVTAVPEQAKNLGKQVFSGSIDPVSVLENGRPETILKAVKKCFDEADRRMIVSAGCEVTPGTPIENFKALCESARSCY